MAFGNQPRIIGQDVKIVEKTIHEELVHEKTPTLSAPLNANGNSILNVKAIDCDTINGVRPEVILSVAVSEIEAAVAKLAKIKHDHPELLERIRDLETQIGRCQPVGEYAGKEHTHTLQKMEGVLPLINLEHGERLASMSKMSYAPSDHTHEDLRDSISALKSDVDGLKGAFVRLEDSIEALLIRFGEAEHTIRTVASDWPKEQKEPVVHIVIKEKPVDEPADVIITNEPYIAVRSIAAYAKFEVTDAKNTHLETRVSGKEGMQVLSFIGGESPYTVTLTKR